MSDARSDKSLLQFSGNAHEMDGLNSEGAYSFAREFRRIGVTVGYWVSKELFLSVTAKDS